MSCKGGERIRVNTAILNIILLMNILYGWKISRVEIFVQFKILPYLENFAGSNSTFHV